MTYQSNIFFWLWCALITCWELIYRAEHTYQIIHFVRLMFLLYDIILTNNITSVILKTNLNHVTQNMALIGFDSSHWCKFMSLIIIVEAEMTFKTNHLHCFYHTDWNYIPITTLHSNTHHVDHTWYHIFSASFQI